MEIFPPKAVTDGRDAGHGWVTTLPILRLFKDVPPHPNPLSSEGARGFQFRDAPMAKTPLLPLTKLDPAEEWQPWQPSAKEPWSLKWAGHLYRRAAFSGSWGELQRAVKEGPEATLDRIFKGNHGSAEFSLDEFNQIMDQAAPKSSNRFGDDGAASELQSVWLYRMIFTPHPLLERLTLFWHNHFATSIAKVRHPQLMNGQNALIRKHALGKFEPLVQAMSKDPAMMLWLDSNSNVKSAPNENYARELMELFTMGVNSGYDETDIREAARAFTGWGTQGNEYRFNKAQHDDGEKTVLKKTGKWNGDDVVRILLEQPVAARFLVRKLYRNFISEIEVPPDSLIEPLAEQFRKSGYDIAGVLRTMLRSRHFFSSYAYRQRVKSPAEYVVGMLRSLEAQVGMMSLTEAMNGMGQILFAPPNVKGWDGGKAWLNGATLIARHNTAWHFLQGEQGPFQAKVNPSALAKKHVGDSPEKQVDFLLDLLLQPAKDEITPEARKALFEYLNKKDPPPKKEPDEKPVRGDGTQGLFLEENVRLRPRIVFRGFVPVREFEVVQIQDPQRQVRPGDDPLDMRARELTHTIMLMPEYQLA